MPINVYVKNGKVVSSDPKEQERLVKRMKIIDKVLKEMGYPEGVERYDEIMNDLGQNHIAKFIEFLKTVDAEVAKE
jgi:SOS-response transcriptional repressor LexA